MDNFSEDIIFDFDKAEREIRAIENKRKAKKSLVKAVSNTANAYSREGLVYEPQQKFFASTPLWTIVFWSCMLIWLSIMICHSISFVLLGEFSEFLDGLSLCAIFFVYLSYGRLMYESFKSKTLLQLREIVSVETATEYINRMKKKVPKIGWICHCFHYGTHPNRELEHSISSIVRYGWNEHMSNQSVLMTPHNHVEAHGPVTIETHSEVHNFVYHDFKDVSGTVSDDLDRFTLVRLQCSQDWFFANQEIEAEYYRQQKYFIQQNEHHDRCFSWRRWFELHDFCEESIFLSSPQNRPWLLGPCQYAIASVLGFSWLYRRWLDRILVSAHFCFTKEVF